jgi:predicted 3-demethylubiquinone-9 3-methyltransferase (glyoxalase superfamily)
MSKISPFLWFDDQAEEAAAFYVSLFPNSRIKSVSRYPEGGRGPAGKAMAVVFEIDGAPVNALNGGPLFTFTEAVSFVIDCVDQAEVDHYWDGLVAGGGRHSQCGWLKDRFGFSWQVVPRALHQLMGDPDPEKAKRVTQAMLGMTKLDVAGLQRAYDG